MKLAVVGSRSITDYEVVKFHLSKYLKQFPDLEIVSGGADGVDKLAERFAQEHNLFVTIIKPDWSKFGRAAGFKRNEEIWQYADCGIAFWDGSSKGTAHSFKLAKKYNKSIEIITQGLDQAHI